MAPRIDTTELERALLRRSVNAFRAGVDRCHDCGRTPLIGERVCHYGARRVCELCRMLRKEPPERVETVHSSVHGQTVRVTARAAA